MPIPLELKVPPPIVLLISGLLIWLTARIRHGTFYFIQQHEVALAIMLVALALMFSAIAAFIVARTTVNPLKPDMASSLLTTGVFAYSRNPIYLADALLLLAWLVYLGSCWGGIFIFAFVLYIHHWQIKPEERVLAQKFGEEYALYCRRVRRWI